MATIASVLDTECVGITIDGKFPLLRWLGGTAHSSVFLTRLESDPAQKAVIKFSPANAPDAAIRFGERARNLSHPHLLRVFHTGRWKSDDVDLTYVVTEYADEVLSDILRTRRLTRDEAREMLDPLLEALGWLHGQNLVHGHLKPSNVMVAGERLKISSDCLHAPGERSWTSSSSGKYDAPEATLLTMSPTADVWSLGMVLVESLTQSPPRWDGRDDPIVPTSIPAPLSGIARECLRVDPARRATLSGIRDSLDNPAPAPAPPARSQRPSRARPSRALFATAALIVAAIGTALFIGFQSRPSSRTSVPGSPPATVTAPRAAQPQSAVTPAPTPAPQQSPRPQVPAAQVSLVKGAVAGQVIPDVPQHILDTIQGHIRVAIDVQVDADGKVAAATVASPGPSRYFANQALEAARNWKFRAAEQNGRPVANRWTLLFRFGPEGTTVTTAETAP